MKLRVVSTPSPTLLHALEWSAAAAIASLAPAPAVVRVVACGLLAATSIRRVHRTKANAPKLPGDDAPVGRPPAVAHATPVPPTDRSAGAASVTALPRSRDRTGSILVAEDDHVNQILITTQLRCAGHTVQLAENGRAAVHLALAALEAGEPYDVIVMDMQMPTLDGYGATRELRSRGYRGAILALTAHAVAGDRERCLDAGCDEYLTKPIDRTKLLGVLRSYVGHARTALEDADTIIGWSPVPDSSEPLFSELADDADVADILADFVSALPGRAAALTSALDCGDSAALTRLVHQLKGAAGGYGFPLITERARAAEEALSIAGDGSQARDAVRALAATCLRARVGSPARVAG